MKSAAISRFVIVAAIAAMNVVGGSTKAWAACPTSPNYTPDFTGTTDCFTANGFSNGLAITTFPSLQTAINPPTPPPTVTTVLRLTQATGSQVGSVWYNTPQTVQNGFSTSFQFELTQAPNITPADGIACDSLNGNAAFPRHSRAWRSPHEVRQQPGIVTFTTASQTFVDWRTGHALGIRAIDLRSMVRPSPFLIPPRPASRSLFPVSPERPTRAR